MLTTIFETFKTHEQLFWLLGLGSIGLLVGTAVLIPWLIIVLPSGFFAGKFTANARQSGSRRIGAALLAIFRNVLGVALLAAGIIMLFIPGQGLLTILVAVALIDFPGKHALLLRLINNPRVFGAANGIRRWAGKPEFLPADSGPRPDEPVRRD